MDASQDPGTTAMLEQFEMENREVEDLVPVRRNRRLRSYGQISTLIADAMHGRDGDGEHGPAPVVRVFAGRKGSVEVVTYRRNGAAPVVGGRPVNWCDAGCGSRIDGGAEPVPFWINCGPVILQTGLCPACAAYAMTNLDALPQTWV